MRTLYSNLTPTDRENMSESDWYEFIAKALTRDPSEWVIDEVDDYIPSAVSTTTRHLVGTGRSKERLRSAMTQDPTGASVLRLMEREGVIVNVTKGSSTARWALSSEIEIEEGLHRLLKERRWAEADARRNKELDRLSIAVGTEILPLIDKALHRAYMAGLAAGREEAQR